MVLVFTTCAFADKPDLWEKRINAQIEYQNRLADLLIRQAPELAEIIVLNRDLQVNLYKMKRVKYWYLLDNHPDRIVPDKGNNFEWVDADEEELTAANKDYRALKATDKQLNAKNQDHPKWPALRAEFGKIQQTSDYKKIHNELMEALK